VTIQLLSDQACATPVGVNPYVSYVNSTAVTQTTKLIVSQNVIASALVPVSSSYVITVPPTTPATGSAEDCIDDDLDASLENLLESLSQQIGETLWDELGKLI